MRLCSHHRLCLFHRHHCRYYHRRYLHRLYKDKNLGLLDLCRLLSPLCWNIRQRLNHCLDYNFQRHVHHPPRHCPNLFYPTLNNPLFHLHLYPHIFLLPCLFCHLHHYHDLTKRNDWKKNCYCLNSASQLLHLYFALKNIAYPKSKNWRFLKTLRCLGLLRSR